jgi:hypothetical protein
LEAVALSTSLSFGLAGVDRAPSMGADSLVHLTSPKGEAGRSQGGRALKRVSLSYGSTERGRSPGQGSQRVVGPEVDEDVAPMALLADHAPVSSSSDQGPITAPPLSDRHKVESPGGKHKPKTPIGIVKSGLFYGSVPTFHTTSRGGPRLGLDWR